MSHVHGLPFGVVEMQMAAKEQQRNGQMPAAVTAKLQSLISGHVVEANDFDSHSLRQGPCCMSQPSAAGQLLGHAYGLRCMIVG